jgi:nucleotide-binding universal stress UspA family protein
MPYKDLLLALGSYPEPMPDTAIEQAAAIAEALGGKLSALTFEIEIPGPVSFYTDAVINISDMIAKARETSAANAGNLLGAFERAAARRGVLGERLLERSTSAEVPDVIVRHARLRDLTILPVRDGDGVEQWYAEGVIFGTGRPTLILPEAPRRGGAPSLDAVTLAWDFSRPAARALADALPILAKAKRVRAVTVTEEKDLGRSQSGADLVRHLALHGIDIAVEEVAAAGRPIGEVLEAAVAAHGSGLLVMGAYGHSRVRDFILGGATKGILARPPVPVFLSH